MKDLLNKAYPLKHIIRYSNVERINNESVAEHSYFVSLIVLELKNYYSFNLSKALKMAIVHDLPEAYIDDINHTIKEQYPAVKKALKEAEFDCIKNFSSIIQNSFIEYEEDDRVECSIVKLADVLQVEQYCESEVRLGNVGYIKSVLEGCEKRKVNLYEKILPYKLDLTINR